MLALSDITWRSMIVSKVAAVASLVGTSMVAGLGLPPVSAGPSSEYTLVPLHVPAKFSSYDSYVSDINKRGDVVGSIYIFSGTNRADRAFFYNAATRKLRVLAAPTGYKQIDAQSISNDGRIVISAQKRTPDGNQQSDLVDTFLLRLVAGKELWGRLYPKSAFKAPYSTRGGAINSHDEVTFAVWSNSSPGPPTFAVVASPTKNERYKMRQLRLSKGCSSVAGVSQIDGDGRVAGNQVCLDGPGPTVWTPKGVPVRLSAAGPDSITSDMADGTGSKGHERVRVIGAVEGYKSSAPCYWDSTGPSLSFGQQYFLPNLGADGPLSLATARGAIVGSSSTTIPYVLTRAVIWTNHSVLDLNAMIPSGSGVTLTAATGINAKGEIIADGQSPNGPSAGYLLEPKP